MTIIEVIRARANQAHSQWPQYAGHWDGDEWVLVQIECTVTTKLGQAFLPGELTIARKETLEGEPVWCAYSMANKCDTVIALSKATEVR